MLTVYFGTSPARDLTVEQFITACTLMPLDYRSGHEPHWQLLPGGRYEIYASIHKASLALSGSTEDREEAMKVLSAIQANLDSPRFQKVKALDDIGLQRAKAYHRQVQLEAFVESMKKRVPSFQESLPSLVEELQEVTLAADTALSDYRALQAEIYQGLEAVAWPDLYAVIIRKTEERLGKQEAPDEADALAAPHL